MVFFVAVDHGADVINLSLSRVENSDTNDPIYISAIEYALEHGVVVTAVTANSSFGETPKEIDTPILPLFPGRYSYLSGTHHRSQYQSLAIIT